jgi:catechol 2,3-dioxygenase-like lactoylglutathione lyase family enzyme
MITGGNVTIFVSNMDDAVKFYSETLGLRLRERYGDHWASVEVNGLVIGLHPASAQSPAGQRGSMSIGFAADRPIEEVVETLAKRGVQFDGSIVDDKAGKFISFRDADGTSCYVFETRPEYAQPGRNR